MSASNKKCIIVDDVVVSRYANRIIFEDLGFDVIEVEDSDACLTALEKETFSVMLVDLHLRRDSGLDLIKKIKSDPKHLASTILICSGVDKAMAPEEFSKVGAAGFISKPSTRQKVEEILKRLRVI